MPTNRQLDRALRKRSKQIRDPSKRFSHLAIRFEVVDGPYKGRITRPFGGVFDKKSNKGRGKFISKWDARLRKWIGEKPKHIHTVKIAHQQLFFILDFTHKWSLALGGRRSGKTAALGMKVVILALAFTSTQGCVISPTYRQSKNVWKAILRACPRDWLKPGTFGVNKSSRTLTFVNNTSIVFLSGDRDDSSRGEGSAFVVLDERQDISEETFSNAYLSASEGGGFSHVSETGTIKPELREHYDKLMDSPKGEVYKLRSRGNPFIDHALFDDAEEILDEDRIKREIDAEWPEAKGLVYYCWDESRELSYPLASYINDTKSTELFLHQKYNTEYNTVNDKRFYIAIDPPHHAVVFKIYHDGTLHVIDEIVVGADGTPGDTRTLSERCYKLYSPAVVVLDPHENRYDSSIRKIFRKWACFRFVSMPRLEIEYRITAVRAAIEKGKVFIDPKCVYLLEALRRQKYDEFKHKPRKDQKSRINDIFTLDHILDAFGYGIAKIYPAKYDFEKHERKRAA